MLVEIPEDTPVIVLQQLLATQRLTLRPLADGRYRLVEARQLILAAAVELDIAATERQGPRTLRRTG